MSNETIESLSDEEDEDEEDEIIVKIKSISKYFSETNLIVVNNVSFNLYKNQITSLLGHNGAGLFYLFFFFILII